MRIRRRPAPSRRLRLRPRLPPASPAAGGALRRDPFPRRGRGARAAAAEQALPAEPIDPGRLARAALLSVGGDPAAPGAAGRPGRPPAVAAAGARQAGFLLPPAVSDPQRRQVRSRPHSPAPATGPLRGLSGSPRSPGQVQSLGSPAAARSLPPPPRPASLVLRLQCVLRLCVSVSGLACCSHLVP